MVNLDSLFGLTKQKQKNLPRTEQNKTVAKAFQK